MGIHKQFRKARLSLACLSLSVGCTAVVAQPGTTIGYTFTSPTTMLLGIEMASFGESFGTASNCSFSAPFGACIQRDGAGAPEVSFGVGLQENSELRDGVWTNVESGVQGFFLELPAMTIDVLGTPTVVEGEVPSFDEWSLRFYSDDSGGSGENWNLNLAEAFTGCVEIEWDDESHPGAVKGWFAESGSFFFSADDPGEEKDILVLSGAGCPPWGGVAGLPGSYFFSAPGLGFVYGSTKGSKNSVNLGNSGFAPIGDGMMVGVGYDRADNSVSNNIDANFDGNEYRIHLDLLKGHNNLIYGIAGEYRESKYTLNDTVTKYKTKYYGPRVDLGYHGMDSWVQLSGGYYFGNAYVDDDKGSKGYLAQLGLLAQMDKSLSNRFSLKPGVNVQYIWQKLGIIDGDKFKNRDYGRADFNLGLGIALVRGWDITPNVGYRWDIQSACTQTDSSEKICEPTASGVRYGVQLAKAVMVTGSHWDQLAVSAYYDYFKKSGVKQSVWGVMAQYPF